MLGKSGGKVPCTGERQGDNQRKRILPQTFTSIAYRLAEHSLCMTSHLQMRSVMGVANGSPAPLTEHRPHDLTLPAARHTIFI